MKKKIILIVVVIFVSLGLLSISKIVQNKYLSNNSDLVGQKANSPASTAANDKPVNPIIVEAPAKTSVQEKSEGDVKATTANKTQQTTTQKPSTTENVAVPKVTTKAAVTKSPEPKKQPNLVIKDYITGKIILSVNVSTENKTVGQITLSELDNMGINYSSTGRGETVYLTMINNLKARGKGPLSGWCYYVNGSKPGVSCGAYKLKSGDVVEWKYLEDAINN